MNSNKNAPFKNRYASPAARSDTISIEYPNTVVQFHGKL